MSEDANNRRNGLALGAKLGGNYRAKSARRSASGN